MVVYETVTVAQPMAALIDAREDFEKCLSVLVVFEHGFFIVAPVGNVLHDAGVFDAERTSHKESLSEVQSKVQHYRPEPKMFCRGLYRLRKVRPFRVARNLSTGKEMRRRHGRPVVGALHGKRARKRVFITTGRFSDDAVKYVYPVREQVLTRSLNMASDHK